MKQKKNYQVIEVSLLFIIVLLIMTPRLASPQFGLLDDGAMLREVQTILSGDVSMQHDVQAGRFRPLYWGYFTLIYALAGPSAFWFFLGHTILFLILVFEIWSLMKQMGGDLLQRLLACFIFVFSMPIIENFYTLSKAEPLQMVFLLLALISFERIKPSSSYREKWPLFFLIFISVIAAMLVKETTMVMLPIVVLYSGFGFFINIKLHKQSNRSNLIFLGIILFAIGATYLLRAVWGNPAIAGGTYTQRYDLSPISLVKKVTRWFTLYAHYFHYLLPFSILGAIAYFSTKEQNPKQGQNLFNWVSWVVIWVIALIPWGFAEVYYLLPFSIGIALITSLIAPKIQIYFHYSNPHKWIATSLMALTIILLLMTFPNFYTHARTQLIVDRTNQQMLASLQKNVPQNGRAFLGLDTQNEYVINTEIFLKDQYSRDDIRYDFVSLENLGFLHRYSQGILVLPYIRNQPDLLVRIGKKEEFTIAWREIIIYEKGDLLTELDRVRGSFRMVNINLPVLFCPMIGERGFCETPDRLIDTREFRYGWEVLEIQ